MNQGDSVQLDLLYTTNVTVGFPRLKCKNILY